MASLEDGGGGSAAEAAGRVERIDAKELVDEAAGDAHHGRAAVLALGVQLEGLGLGVVVAHPRDASDVTGLVGRVDASVARGVRLGDEVAGLDHAGGEHDLQPARGGDGLERGEEASRGSGALLSRDADASLDGDDVEEAKHGRAAVLDLHDLVAAHAAGLDEAERVVDTQGREHAKVALREHGEGHRAGGGLEGRGLEGLDGLEERKGDNGDGLHDFCEERSGGRVSPRERR
mmetsp:Transcript_34007/g.76995  ORF Transcript_34007/g.76995 Transcript_34007/m.76995 type:complete len:233 (+) Transcript_34007:283-981(+)